MLGSGRGEEGETREGEIPQFLVSGQIELPNALILALVRPWTIAPDDICRGSVDVNNRTG